MQRVTIINKKFIISNEKNFKYLLKFYFNVFLFKVKDFDWPKPLISQHNISISNQKHNLLTVNDIFYGKKTKFSVKILIYH